MSSNLFDETSVVRIFNELEFEEERLNCDGYSRFYEKAFFSNMDVPAELVEVLKCMKPVTLCVQVIDAAIEAQKTWRSSSPQQRANTLHKIWEYLKNILGLFPKLMDELSLFTDYFDFYSDVLLHIEDYEKWRPHGVVLIVLSDDSPLFAVAASVPAALVAGCSVIVLAPKTMETFLLFLEVIFLKTSLPEGVFKVATATDEIDVSMSSKISKVFLCGSYKSAQKFYTNNLVKSFNFFCPNNTAAFVLESADLNAAVDKIISQTWGQEEPVFAVSNVIVQESVYKDFFDKLKYKITQFMNENKYSSKFKDEIISEKIQKIIADALSAGAIAEEYRRGGCGEWGPTVIVNYQDQDTDQDVPILKLLICRTAKEGVALLNNCRFTLGVSVWSEISSQALEISSKLISPNVWVNCHGAFDAGVPLQLSGFSGNCVLGGSDGIMEYTTLRLNDPVEGFTKNEDEESNFKKPLGGAVSAHQAFTAWQHNKNRRQCLKKIANSLTEDLHDLIHYYAHSAYIINLSDRNSSEEFFFVKKKIPIGVILLIVNTEKISKKSIISLITPAIALGNAVIIVLKKDNPSIQSLMKIFIKSLPGNLLSVIVGLKAGIHLVSDPNIQRVWFYDETSVSSEFLEIIRKYSARNLKHIWIVPEKVPISQHLFQKECLQNKTIWLTKIDQFP